MLMLTSNWARRLRASFSVPPTTFGTSIAGRTGGHDDRHLAADVDERRRTGYGPDHEALGDGVVSSSCRRDLEPVRVALEERRASSSGSPTTIAGIGDLVRPRGHERG